MSYHAGISDAYVPDVRAAKSIRRRGLGRSRTAKTIRLIENAGPSRCPPLVGCVVGSDLWRQCHPQSLGAEPPAEKEETVPAISTCPVCSYFQAGDCLVCEDGDTHPGCDGCKGGRLRWYRSPLVVAVVTGVAVSIVAAFTLTKLRERGVLRAPK